MLSNKQKEIVESKESKVVVNCSAASGKTYTLIERIKYLLNSGINPEKIVAITFTNAAAEEIKERIGEKGKNCFIGTIHSYCNYLLLCNGIDTSDLIETENFDYFFHRFKEHLECKKEIDYLLLDEAQDSTYEQFEFLLDMLKPKNWMLFGDHRQSIYGFNGANPEYLIKLMNDKEVKVYNMNENYRNGSNILSFAKNIIDKVGYNYRDNSIPKSNRTGTVMTLSYSINGIYNFVSKDDNYKDWFIITRTNSQLDYIYSYLTNKGIPCSTFKRSELSNEQFNSEMKKNTVKILTIHTSKGLENKKVIVVGASAALRRDIEEVRVAYVAATRAKELLIWMGNRTKPVENKIKTYNWEK